TMSLRGSGDGGFYQALDSSWIGSADLSVFLWIKSIGTPAIASRIFGLYQARSRGFLIFNGSSYVSGSTNLSICCVAGPGVDTQWGNNASQAGRGMAHVAGALSGGGWVPVCAVIRGSGAPDNTGSGNAQQIHSLHVGGAAGTVGSTTSGIAPAATGSRGLLLANDTSANFFSGAVAECTVWVGYRLSDVERQALEGGADPATIAPEYQVYRRSFRNGLAGEVWDGTLVALGAGATLDLGDHPPIGGDEPVEVDVALPFITAAPLAASAATGAAVPGALPAVGISPPAAVAAGGADVEAVLPDAALIAPAAAVAGGAVATPGLPSITVQPPGAHAGGGQSVVVAAALPSVAISAPAAQIATGAVLLAALPTVTISPPEAHAGTGTVALAALPVITLAAPEAAAVGSAAVAASLPAIMVAAPSAAIGRPYIPAFSRMGRAPAFRGGRAPAARAARAVGM
ncbi:hypothetical protein, partial [Pedomonas sp. V897]|uniref:hypothetical protein n=2 Tax=Pedomonas sp. V897 TaxID=3446482 RepID=UPI003EDE9616